MDSAVLTTNNGADHSRRHYAYGRKRYGTTDTLYRYGGHMEDSTGLIYMNARYYDPQMGLFISPDSIIPDPTNVLDYNRYAYARGNPVSNNDPSGHSTYAYNDSHMLNFPFEIGGGGGGGSAALVFIAGVAYFVVVDEVTKEWKESWPLNQPNPVAHMLPNVPPATPASSVPPIQEQTMPLPQESVPLATPNMADLIVNAGGVEPNNIGTWAAEQVGAQLPIRIRQTEVEINGQIRVYDGQLPISGRYVEIKGGVGLSKSSISLSSRINEEIAFDSQMAIPPLWVFVGKPPSSGLSESLDDNGIPWINLNPFKNYSSGGN